MSTYTMADLEQAKKDLDHENERWNNYDGNNPNKYQSDIKSARQKVSMIEQELKTSGVIPLTETEKLNQELDNLHPNARSKQIVEHNGFKYTKRFTPREKSRSGKSVTSWDTWWEKND